MIRPKLGIDGSPSFLKEMYYVTELHSSWNDGKFLKFTMSRKNYVAG